MDLDLRKIPLAPAPMGQMSNLVNPMNMAYRYYIVATISTVLMLCFVSARVYARFWHLKKPWWDDLSCVIATILTCIFTGTVIKFCYIGVGRHIWDIPLSSLHEFAFLAVFISVLSAPTIAFTKLTIFLLYLRLFGVNVWVKRGAWAGIISIVIFYTIAAFLYILENSQHVIAEMTYSVGVFGVISDVYMICLPIPSILNLNLNFKKKIALLGIFLSGALAAIMSIVGCVFRFEFSTDEPDPTLLDLSWKLLNILLVVTIEIDIGIMCSCMPAASVLFTQNNTTKTNDRPFIEDLPVMKKPRRSRMFPSVSSYKQSTVDTSMSRATILSMANRPRQARYIHTNESSDGIVKEVRIQVTRDHEQV